MRIHFTFEQNDESFQRTTLTETAFALSQLQLLWLFVIFLTIDEDEYASSQTYPAGLRYLEQSLTVDFGTRTTWLSEPDNWYFGIMLEPDTALVRAKWYFG